MGNAQVWEGGIDKVREIAIKHCKNSRSKQRAGEKLPLGKGTACLA